MAGSLNSNIFLSAQDIFKKRCVTLFLDAYHLSKKENLIPRTFDENDISSILHNYIKKNPKRKNWKISSQVESHIFDETPLSYTKGFAAKQSRIDFKFGNFWKNDEYEFFVEAKNLKSIDSSLKRRYIDTGINNFLPPSGKYKDCNGFLIGYVLEGTINDCVSGINKLLEKDKRQSEVLVATNILSYDIYSSKHQTKDLAHIFLLYTN